MWFIFALLDPDPDSESGSTDPIESGSNSDPDTDPDPDPQPCLKCRHSVHVHHQVRCQGQLIVADVGGLASTAVAVAVAVAVAADIRPATLG